MRKILAALAMGSFVALGLTSVGCSSGPSAPKVANVQPGEMPAGGEWSAEYYDVLVGKIIIIAKGNEVRGKWQRPHGDKWADFHGSIDGNLLKFDWTEYDTGAVGPNTSRSGKGYLVYKRPAGDNVDDHVTGEIGRQKDETGDPIDAIKQRNVVPDLDKIGGTSARDLGGGGDWDKGNGEPGRPEAPVPP
ncbi:MAG: hypothetical protein U0414_00750 [Polyangiaceae bacterium]